MKFVSVFCCIVAIIKRKEIKRKHWHRIHRWSSKSKNKSMFCLSWKKRIYIEFIGKYVFYSLIFFLLGCVCELNPSTLIAWLLPWFVASHTRYHHIVFKNLCCATIYKTIFKENVDGQKMPHKSHTAMSATNQMRQLLEMMHV